MATCPKCGGKPRLYTVPSMYSREAEFTCDACNDKQPRTPWNTYIPVTFYLPIDRKEAR